jgi:hypothetical protein
LVPADRLPVAIVESDHPISIRKRSAGRTKPNHFSRCRPLPALG